jgi:chromosome segregation ATPase
VSQLLTDHRSGRGCLAVFSIPFVIMSETNKTSSSAAAALTSPQEHFTERLRLLQGENDLLREKKGEVEFKLDHAYLQLGRVFDGLNNKLERATEAMLTGTPIVEELLQCQAILHELKSTLSNNDQQYTPLSKQQQSKDTTFSPRGYYKKRCQELEKEVSSLQKDLNEAMDEFDQEFDPVNEENQEIERGTQDIQTGIGSTTTTATATAITLPEQQ